MYLFMDHESNGAALATHLLVNFKQMYDMPTMIFTIFKIKCDTKMMIADDTHYEFLSINKVCDCINMIFERVDASHRCIFLPV